MCCIERVCYVERKVAVAGGVEQRRVCTLSLVFCVLLGRATPRTRKEERSREILSAHWLQAALDSLVGPTRRLPHRHGTQATQAQEWGIRKTYPYLHIHDR